MGSVVCYWVIDSFKDKTLMSSTFSGLLTAADSNATTLWPAVSKTVVAKDAASMLMSNEAALAADSKPAANHVRIVCISDTHNAHDGLTIPECDVLIHGGDFTDVGSRQDVLAFADWLEKQTQCKHRVVIAGNHDLSLDAASYEVNYKRFNHSEKYDTEKLVQRMREVCHYLDHEPVEVAGLRFFGSPYQPEFHDWAFNLPRGQPCFDKWASMRCAGEQESRNIDVLLTHGPPMGHGDECVHGELAGCAQLLDFVEHAEPLLHVFGHVHEGYGATHNGRTLLLNASSMNLRYQAHRLRPPMVVDVPVGLPREEQVAAWRARLDCATDAEIE